jgi:hypothetical protein
MKAYVHCPHCNAKVRHNPSQNGQTKACPSCRHPFQMPVVTTANPNMVFSHAPQSSYGDNPREPWYYGFLEAYAKVGLWLTFVLAAIAAGDAARFCHHITTTTGPSGATAAQIVLGWEAPAVWSAYLFFLVTLSVLVLASALWTARCLLAVDEGRSLRGIYKNVRGQQ